jgi:hypothetical protein
MKSPRYLSRSSFLYLKNAETSGIIEASSALLYISALNCSYLFFVISPGDKYSTILGVLKKSFGTQQLGTLNKSVLTLTIISLPEA